jgi:AraC family transcriptional regulator, transcriptional activator of pobA
MREKPTEIPFYGLYGEPLKTSNPGLVHIEEIVDRSRGRDWIIKTHRHSKLFQVICIEDGHMEMTLQGQPTQTLTGTWIISIPMGLAHGFQFQPDSKGFVLSIDNTVLVNSDMQNELQDLLLAPQLIQSSQKDLYIHQFLHYIGLLREEFSALHAKRNHALEGLSRLALLSLTRQLQQNRINHEIASVDSQTLNKFCALMESHYREHWSVAGYADQLHVSTSTLSRLCHKYIGESPKIILQERLLMEAKKQLLYTQQSVEEIAFSLGFKDCAYFARFFKLHAGITPGTYRKKTG